ncbi:MAG: TonB-dependent receptor [Acidobacteriota bacterium]
MRSLFAGCALFLLPAGLAAQETRGMIYGRVLDPQAGAVVGASVTVTNVDTNVSVELSTNATGYYEASLLVAGNYRIAAATAGFKESIRSGIRLSVGGRVEIDFQLELGAVSESITVAAQAPLLDTYTASSGRTVDERSLRDLPMMGNQPTLLIQLAPGMNDPGYVSYTVPGYTIANSRYYTVGNVGGNDYSIDGAPNAGTSRRIAFVPLSDTLEEFRVETSNFDASVGHTVGASIAMMTKSGGNEIHGSVTEMHTQQRWNAASFYRRQLYYQSIAQAESAGDAALVSRLKEEGMSPPGHSNKYQFSLGGPVYLPKLFDGRNRMFFFISYNAIRDRFNTAAGNELFTVPTMANRGGDFSGLLQANATQYQIYDPLTVRPDPARATHYIRAPFPGNIIAPSRVINPAYQAYLKILPLPNNDPLDPRQEPVDNLNNARGPWNIDYTAVSNRIDYQASSRHRFFGRWSWNSFLEDEDDWTWSSARGLHSSYLTRPNLSATADWVYTPGATTVLDFTLSSSSYLDGSVNQVRTAYKPSDVGLPAYLDEKAGAYHSLPSMSFSGYQAFSTAYPGVTHTRQLSAKADISHVRGSHSLRAGFDQRQRFRTNSLSGTLSGSFSFTNSYTRRNDDTLTPAGNLGHSWAAFMLGVPSAMSVSTNDTIATHNPAYGAYVQDNWRLTTRLSLNLGLRWEYEDGPTERFNRQISYFDATAQLPITAGAQAAYAARPLPELPAPQFSVLGGSVYSGVKGVDRRRWRGQTFWMPRVSAAYQLNPKTVLRAGYGMFFDTLNVLDFSPDLTGYSRTTSTNVTNDFGMTWLAGNPGAGIAPMADPFPVRADGTRFDLPVQNKLGLLARTGSGWTYYAFDPARPRVQRFRLSIQRQLGTDTMIDVAYARSSVDRMPISVRQDPLPETYWASGQVRNDALASNLNTNVTNPFQISNFASMRQSDPLLYQQMSTLSFFTSQTIRKNQLLRQFPQMNGLYRANYPGGKLHSNALEIQFLHRFSHGFHLNLAYTEMRAYEKTFIADEFALPPAYLPTQNGRPHRLTGTGIFEFPFGKGRHFWKNGPLNWVFGGWQVGATYEWQPGSLLEWPNLFYSGDPKDIAIGSPSINQWFNTANFERNPSKAPAAFHRRVFPRVIEGLRGPQMNIWQSNLLRQFSLRERISLEFRFDALNLANRSQFTNPNTTPTSTNFGRLTALWAESIQRTYQIQARLRF